MKVNILAICLEKSLKCKCLKFTLHSCITLLKACNVVTFQVTALRRLSKPMSDKIAGRVSRKLSLPDPISESSSHAGLSEHDRTLNFGGVQKGRAVASRTSTPPANGSFR